MEKAKNSGGKSTGPPKVPTFARNARPKQAKKTSSFIFIYD